MEDKSEGLNAGQNDERVPLVFLSYSHDSDEHKQWVLELAQRLRVQGIEVILDQWELPYGGDIPKFMENSVRRAERVLMICTTNYVQKVDEGIGGAGYEGMIVSAELIRDLGQKKFVPIIRQDQGSFLMPACLGARLAIDLSAQGDTQSEFTKLEAEIFNDPPPTKPPLGKRSRNAQATIQVVPVEPGAAASDPLEAYHQALRIARHNDLVAWRKLVGSAKVLGFDRASTWAKDSRDRIDRIQKVGDAISLFAEGLKFYQPLFAVAMGGVDSSNDKYSRHGSLVLDLISMEEWHRRGAPFSIFPPSMAFVFQALLGAKYVHAERMDFLTELAAQRVTLPGTTGPLLKNRRLMGWPEVFQYCTFAWDFLWSMCEANRWLIESFESQEVFQECLCGYYAVLSWMEFVYENASGVSSNEDLSVPVCYAHKIQHQRGIRRVLADREPLRDWARAMPYHAQNEAWPKWNEIQRDWLSNVYKCRGAIHDDSDRVRFVEDLYAGHEGPLSPGISS